MIGPCHSFHALRYTKHTHLENTISLLVPDQGTRVVNRVRFGGWTISNRILDPRRMEETPAPEPLDRSCLSQNKNVFLDGFVVVVVQVVPVFTHVHTHRTLPTAPWHIKITQSAPYSMLLKINLKESCLVARSHGSYPNRLVKERVYLLITSKGSWSSEILDDLIGMLLFMKFIFVKWKLEILHEKFEKLKSSHCTYFLYFTSASFKIT